MADYAAWLAIGIAGIVSLAAVILVSGFRGRSDYRASGTDSGTKRKLDDIDGRLTLLSRYLEEEVPRAVLNGIRGELDGMAGRGPGVQTSETAASLIREISHSLNTPLAQIEASVLSLDRSAIRDTAKHDNILEGVRICKSFLAAFREVATLTRDVHAWSPDSIAKAVRSASALYAHRAGKSPQVEVHVADSVPGYNNNYLMAVLLPLVENAMDAVKPDGSVKVTGALRGDVYVIDVCNDGVTGELPEDIYENGFTTKHEHEGLGLATVRRLVASKRDARIGHKVDGSFVTFTVELPRGASS
jgi:signal transduction histidine kinase